MNFLNLNALNIRSGLELDVPVKDIFKIPTNPEGNIKAKEWYSLKNKNKNFILKDLEKDGFIIYDDTKTKIQLNNTLDCYQYDSYMVYIKDFNDTINQYNLGFHKSIDLLFVNKEQLSIEEFCINFMEAQSYSGNFKKPELTHPFIGCGNFDLSEYAKFHELITYSNINLINFYVYHSNILSSVGHFIGGLFENDIEEQKKYITPDEEQYLKKLVESQRSIVLSDSDGTFLKN